MSRTNQDSSIIEYNKSRFPNIRKPAFALSV